MNTRKLGPIRGVAFAALACLVGLGVGLAETGTPVDAETINLIEAVRGICLKSELSTEQGCVVPPRIKKQVRPRFPRAARRAEVQGKVVLGATVETDGNVGSVVVLDSTKPGYGFEEAGIAAVQKWRYEPGRLADVPVRIYFKVTVDFTLQ